jgi:hypothetical protein
MNLNNIKMIIYDKEEEEDITCEFMLKHVKNIKEEAEIIFLYNKIQKNKELIDELIKNIDEETENQLNIESYMNNEYMKIYNLIKDDTTDTNTARQMCGIFSEYGTTTVFTDINKNEIILISLLLERACNCSYLYNSDTFCEKLIKLRYTYRKNRTYAYNFIELIKKNNIQYENLQYFRDYLENYE